LGVTIAGYRAWDPAAQRYDALAARVAAPHAEGVFVAGLNFNGGDRVVKSLRARLGRRVKIIAPDAFVAEELLRTIGPAALGTYLIAEGVLPERSILGPAGRRFVREFGADPPFGTPFTGVLEGAQAAEIVLQAIASSDGTRGSVLRELRRVRVQDGLLGSFSFNRRGEISPAAFTILRITGSSPNSIVPGAIVDRLVRVPGKLASR
jgi:branched-chain amino acid transport system substrate-binding protein